MPKYSNIYAARVVSSGTVQSSDITICAETNSQNFPKLAPYDGGAYIVWEDYRSGNCDLYAQLVTAAGSVQWISGGIPLSTAAGAQGGHQIAYDDDYCAIISWQDLRNGSSDINIYAQKLDPPGTRLWNTHSGGDSLNGLPVCVAANNQEQPSLMAGNGEAIIAWHDARGTAKDIYAQRLDASGNMLWAADGQMVCGEVLDQETPVIASGSGGGAVLAWTDHRYSQYDIFAQKVSAAGIVGSPPSPELTWPPLDYPTNTSEMQFRWRSVPLINLMYQLQISSDDTFNTIVFNDMFDDTVVSPMTTIGPDGHYFWRCRAWMSDMSDSSAWSVSAFYLDNVAPPPPNNLQANGQSPSPWTATNSFVVTGDVSGLDPSGTSLCWYKRGSRPTSNNDYDGYSDAFTSINFTTAAISQGPESIFVWVDDKAGNGNYQDPAWTMLRWDQTPPEAAVHVPNGTETWTAGEIRNITWAHFDSCTIAYDSLYYSTNGGSTWTPISRVYPPDTIKVWAVPSTPSTTCRVKVVVRDSAGNRYEDISNNDFTILPATTPTLAVDFTTWNPPPGGGDTLLYVYNSADTVTMPVIIQHDSVWMNNNPYNDSTPCYVTLHVDPNYSGYLRLGHFSVESPGDPYQSIELTVTQASLDTVHPWASITNPQPGETKYCGTSLNITWSEGDNVGVAQDSLEYSLDGGASWTFITKGPIPANGHVWPVPNTPTGLAMVRVTVTDSTGNTGQGASGLFTIADSTRPTVSVTMPFIGVVWPAGNSQAIMWTQGDNVGVVRDSVVFSPDGGGSWQQVYAGPATTMFQWSVPHVHSAMCFIRVVATDSSGNQGQNTSGSFEVRDTIPPQVTAIISPAAGAVWGIGTLREISWQQQDNVSIGYDSLLYSTDGGGSGAISPTCLPRPATSGRCRVRPRPAAG